GSPGCWQAAILLCQIERTAFDHHVCSSQVRAEKSTLLASTLRTLEGLHYGNVSARAKHITSVTFCVFSIASSHCEPCTQKTNRKMKPARRKPVCLESSTDRNLSPPQPLGPALAMTGKGQFQSFGRPGAESGTA